MEQTDFGFPIGKLGPFRSRGKARLKMNELDLKRSHHIKCFLYGCSLYPRPTVRAGVQFFVQYFPDIGGCVAYHAEPLDLDCKYEKEDLKIIAAGFEGRYRLEKKGVPTGFQFYSKNECQDFLTHIKANYQGIL